MCCLLRIPFVIGFILAPNLYFLLPLVFFKEVLDVIFDPARQAYIRFVVPQDQLQEANALSQLSMNGAKSLHQHLEESLSRPLIHRWCF
jgi:hypothetical protein